jgi:hypothetical protein
MYSERYIAATPRCVFAFGHLRINAWLAAPRSLTQPSHVLHRLPTPKHPPCTLRSLTTFILERRRACARRRYGNLPCIALKEIAAVDDSTVHLSKIRRSGHRSGACSHRETMPSHEYLAPQSWWRRQDSNLRPSPCKGDALPVELRPRVGVR